MFHSELLRSREYRICLFVYLFRFERCLDNLVSNTSVYYPPSEVLNYIQINYYERPKEP